MLIATFTALYFLLLAGPGGRIDQIEALVAQHVAENDRVEKIHANLEDMRTAITSFHEETTRLRQLFWEVDANHDATREDYFGVYEKIEAVWERTELRLLRLRFTMRSHMTQTEWEAVFGALREQSDR